MRPDRSIVASASMLLPSGIFYSLEHYDGVKRLLVATDPGQIVRARRGGTKLDRSYLQDFSTTAPRMHRTPYQEITRNPAGDTMIWPAIDSGRSTTRTAQWCGPDTLADPHLEGPEAKRAYLAVFDKVIDTLAARTGPLVATVSGGLDSTFMAASLLRHATPDRPLLGYCHSPVPGAGLRPIGNWDPDDLPYAKSLQQAHPRRCVISPLQNLDRVTPLQAATQAFQRSWLPSWGPANNIWLNQFNQIAAEQGARLQFRGGNGNATFSYGHPYAARYYWEAHQLAKLLSLRGTRASRQLSLAQAMRKRVIGPLRPNSQNSWPVTAWELMRSWISSHSERQSGHLQRRQFLEWATRRDSSLIAAANPAASPGALIVDPFNARPLAELAAQITPRQWQAGPTDRGFARQLGEGRVPDQIRLRTRRGAQGWDAMVNPVVKDHSPGHDDHYQPTLGQYAQAHRQHRHEALRAFEKWASGVALRDGADV